jgi:hypothetical protein
MITPPGKFHLLFSRYTLRHRPAPGCPRQLRVGRGADHGPRRHSDEIGYSGTGGSGSNGSQGYLAARSYFGANREKWSPYRIHRSSPAFSHCRTLTSSAPASFHSLASTAAALRDLSAISRQAIATLDYRCLRQGVSDPLQTRIRHLGPRDVQHLETAHSLEALQTRVGNPGLAEVEFLQLSQRRQVGRARVSDSRLGQIK